MNYNSKISFKIYNKHVQYINNTSTAHSQIHTVAIFSIEVSDELQVAPVTF